MEKGKSIRIVSNWNGCPLYCCILHTVCLIVLTLFASSFSACLNWMNKFKHAFYVNEGVVVRTSEPLLACVHTPGVCCWGCVAAFMVCIKHFSFPFIFFFSKPTLIYTERLKIQRKRRLTTCKFLSVYQSKEGYKTVIH